MDLQFTPSNSKLAIVNFSLLSISHLKINEGRNRKKNDPTQIAKSNEIINFFKIPGTEIREIKNRKQIADVIVLKGNITGNKFSL